jgi:putative endonuclease
MAAWFYILRLKSGALYVGATTDLTQRYKDYCSGKACRTTSLDPPVAVIYSEAFETFSDARRREALARGDLETLHLLAKRRPDPSILINTMVSLS